MEAAVTSTTSSSPVVSVAMCRLRPWTSFPPSKPRPERATVSAARTDRGVHQRSGWLRLAAFGEADLVAQRVVQLVEGAVPGPAGVVGVDDLPGWEVGR